MRKRLTEAMDIVELAFSAADVAEDERLSGATKPTDVFSFAVGHAERLAIVRFKNTIREMALIPREQIGPLEASYNGVDPFDQLAIDAKAEYDKAHPPKTTVPIDNVTTKPKKR